MSRYKDYNLTDFFNICQPIKANPAKYLPNNSTNQHFSTSLPQSNPSPKTYSTNMEIDMNYPNDVKPVTYPPIQQQQQPPVQQMPIQQQPPIQQPPVQLLNNQQTTQQPGVYYNPYQAAPVQAPLTNYFYPQPHPYYYQPPPQMGNQSHIKATPEEEFVKFTTKNGKTVQFKAKKEKKAKIIEQPIPQKEIIKKDEQTPMEIIPQLNNTHA